MPKMFWILCIYKYSVPRHHIYENKSPNYIKNKFSDLKNPLFDNYIVFSV